MISFYSTQQNLKTFRILNANRPVNVEYESFCLALYAGADTGFQKKEGGPGNC